jgi:hypothetical protein
MLQFDLTTFVRRRRLPQFLRISVPPRAIPYTGHPTQKVLDTTPSSNRHSSVSSWGVPGPAQFHAMHNSETIVLNLGGHTRTRESSAALASSSNRAVSFNPNEPAESSRSAAVDCRLAHRDYQVERPEPWHSCTTELPRFAHITNRDPSSPVRRQKYSSPRRPTVEQLRGTRTSTSTLNWTDRRTSSSGSYRY